MLDLEVLREYIEHKQYAKIRSEIVDENEADIAAVLEELELPTAELIKVFRMLPKSHFFQLKMSRKSSHL